MLSKSVKVKRTARHNNSRFIYQILIMVFTLQAPLSADSAEYCRQVEKRASEVPTSVAQPQSQQSLRWSLNQAQHLSPEELFIEKLRQRMYAIADQSSAEAKLIRHCFSETREQSPLAGFESFQQLAKALEAKCVEKTKEIRLVAAKLRELRLSLALQAGRLKAYENYGIENVEKISINIRLPHTKSFVGKYLPFLFAGEIAPLTADEVKNAIKLFDDHVEKLTQEAIASDRLNLGHRITQIDFASRWELRRGNNVLQMVLSEPMRKFREAHAKRVRDLLQAHPFLWHFKDQDISESGIRRAARVAETKSELLIAKLKEMRSDLSGSEALKLMRFQEVVDQVLHTQPRLCEAADNLSFRSDLHYWGEAAGLIIAAPIVGGICSIFLNPVGCFAAAGTGGALIHANQTWGEYVDSVSTFESIIVSGKSLVSLSEDLDPQDRDLLISYILVIAPYEVVMGKAWEKLLHHEPRFARMVNNMRIKTDQAARDVLGRFYDASVAFYRTLKAPRPQQ